MGTGPSLPNPLDPVGMAEWLFGELRWKGNNFTPLTDTSRHDSIPNVDQGNDKLQPHKGGSVPVSPGYKFNDPALPPGWGNRAGTKIEPVGYGPHNSYLTDEQARALHLLWMVTGQDGATVGNGRVRLVSNEQDAPAVGMPNQGLDGNEQRNNKLRGEGGAALME